MNQLSVELAAISQSAPQVLDLSGHWTALGIGAIERELKSVRLGSGAAGTADASGIDALDTAGALTLQKLLLRLRVHGGVVLRGLRPEFATLLGVVAERVADKDGQPAPIVGLGPRRIERIGRKAVAAVQEASGLLGFVGESAACFASSVRHPTRIRWRPILFNLHSAGLNALPIVGLLSFLLGIVVAYQGADQLRQYGANIFVADLIGLSMLREFAPLITAIIIAGRSGSAYAAQIGTMAVTEEIDAMRTIGIKPLEMLVLPKTIALVIAMPLLTAAADVCGVFGGMIMARVKLDVSFAEFIHRFLKAVSTTSYLVGIGKAPVFAVIIVVVGCFQGFRTQGGADSVGRQTTRSVVQSIVFVIVADGLFSIAFSALDL
jgi:phospholipid/cholesterol/gamma-HCH transport system permease protein